MILEIKKITYQHPTSNKKTLEDINMKVIDKQIVLISGKSGSGKTSLLEIVGGLLSEQKGDIFWNNKKISSRQRRWLCGIVFQFPEISLIMCLIRLVFLILIYQCHQKILVEVNREG